MNRGSKNSSDDLCAAGRDMPVTEAPGREALLGAGLRGSCGPSSVLIGNHPQVWESSSSTQFLKGRSGRDHPGEECGVKREKGREAAETKVQG